jgi:hypothetical protein
MSPFTVADNQDHKPFHPSLGHPPFTPAPEETPAPEHFESPPESPERTELSNEEDSISDSESVTHLLTKTSREPANMSESQSIKMVIEPLNDTNFTTWRFKIINALGYHKLDEYVLEDSDELKARADYKDKKKQATTYI